MRVSRRREINRIAEHVRTGLELPSVPFPVDMAVQRLGGRVEIDPSLDADALVKKERDAFVIVLADQAETRRRFSLAHELGHLFLHMGYIIDPAKWASIDEYRDSPRYRYGFSEDEFEAHEFAGALLMPSKEFRAMVESLARQGNTPLAPLAERFNVSIEAARIRGQWLGVFEWTR